VFLMRRSVLLRHAAAAFLGGLVVLRPSASLSQTPSDLDLFMQQVLARRDDNWKKLQQYVLDEREKIDLRGPLGQTVWGEQRDFTWYIRDGYFIRSPLKFNGVAISESDRRKYEAEFLRRTERREKYRSQGRPAEEPPAPPTDPKTLPDESALLRQTREPQFITSAYFLRFKFEEGKYALVGHEQLEGRDVLRIEYYPAKLFLHQQRRAEQSRGDADKARAAELERMMNKVSLVTLWIDPSLHQILKYTFENVDADFLPAAWLVRVDTVRASMTMGQAFPDVWLPRGLDAQVTMTLALGTFDARYTLDYHDYKLADVTSKIHIPKDH
jgi:hypothetical protein